MQNTILSAIIFLGFVTILIGGFYSSSYQAVTVSTGVSASYNSTNFTLIGGADTAIGSLPACQFGKGIDIPILGGVIWGAACITEYTAWLFSLVFVQTNILWLQVIIVGIGAVIIYAIARLLRGGG